ncbi:arsenic resistance protein [Jeotgalibacillus sp. S-D1]|uniref:arsenic resistance protein n=1 Tax=Jeotgalibacillus sp. S-D1 TaxID=2552189 RepID=UPI00105976D3|nr:bile acid:sodium symporter [Jeotgalibacillus sp. S-D1]TDL31772.1 arsenic resistance protein [Jeotgalibacillus sp. S-D1]
MNRFEKFHPLWITLSIGAGFLLGQSSYIKGAASEFITPLLMIMLYFSFVQISLSQIKKGFTRKSFLWSSTVMNFVATPLLAWGVAALFFGDQPALWIGFIMLMVTPCTDWYIIFTGIAKGDTALSTSLLPINLLLQFILLPLYLYLFTGASGMVDYSFVIEGIILVLFLPFLLSIASRKIILRNKSSNFIEKIQHAPIIFLCLTIMALFASQGELVLEYGDLLLRVFFVVMFFFLLLFFIGRVVARGMGFSTEERASFHMTTIARNSPIALAIALTSFPNEPLIATVLIIAPLIELPVLAILAFVIVKLDQGR